MSNPLSLPAAMIGHERLAWLRPPFVDRHQYLAALGLDKFPI